LLLTGGAVAAVLLLGGSDSRLFGGGALPGPVTEEPEEQWSWRPPGVASGATAVGDVLVVGSDDEHGVVALDEKGEELWTSDIGDYPYSFLQYEEIVFVSSFGDGDVSALSVDDGEELWSVDGGYVSYPSDKGLIYTDFDEAEVGLLDDATGDELWSVTSLDSYAVTEDAVYVLDGSELSRLAVVSGDEEWSVRTDFESDDENYVSLTANDDLVLLGGDDAVAFDARDGAELWSESLDEGDEVEIYSADQVYIATAGDTVDDPVAAVTVYDRDGMVGRVAPDEEAFYFSATPFEVDGKPYVLDYSSGRIFDQDLEEVGQYDGRVTLVDEGLYTLAEDGGVSYYELGSTSPAWSIDTPGSADGETEVALVALDGRLVVVTGDEVISYE